MVSVSDFKMPALSAAGPNFLQSLQLGSNPIVTSKSGRTGQSGIFELHAPKHDVHHEALEGLWSLIEAKFDL